jgi:mono/diheme cytochrome c family protein
MKWDSKLALLVSATVCAAACSSPRRSEPIRGEVPLRSASVEKGQRVFFHACDACHVGGEGGLGPSLNEKPLPEFAMRYQVRHGLGAMPAFDEQEISDDALDDLMAYVKTLRHGS